MRAQDEFSKEILNEGEEEARLMAARASYTRTLSDSIWWNKASGIPPRPASAHLSGDRLGVGNHSAVHWASIFNFQFQSQSYWAAGRMKAKLFS